MTLLIAIGEGWLRAVFGCSMVLVLRVGHTLAHREMVCGLVSMVVHSVLKSWSRICNTYNCGCLSDWWPHFTSLYSTVQSQGGSSFSPEGLYLARWGYVLVCRGLEVLAWIMLECSPFCACSQLRLWLLISIGEGWLGAVFGWSMFLALWLVTQTYLHGHTAVFITEKRSVVLSLWSSYRIACV